MEEPAGWLCVGVAGGHVEDFHQLVSWCSEAGVPSFGCRATTAEQPTLQVCGWPAGLTKVLEDEDSRTCYVWVDLQIHHHTSHAVGGKDEATAAQQAMLVHERACLQALLLLFLTAHVVILLHEGTQLRVPLLSQLRVLQAAKSEMCRRLGLGNGGNPDSQYSLDSDEDEDKDEGVNDASDNAQTERVDAALSCGNAVLKEMLLQRPPTLLCMFQVELSTPAPIDDVHQLQAELNSQVKTLLLRCRVLPPSPTQPLLFHLHPQQTALLVPALVPGPHTIHTQVLEALTAPAKLHGGAPGAHPSFASMQYWSAEQALADFEQLLATERSFAEGGASSWNMSRQHWPVVAHSLQLAMNRAKAGPLAPTSFTMPLKAPPGQQRILLDAWDGAAGFLEACSGLAQKFSAEKCRKALLAAREAYLRDLPPCFSRSVHDAALLSALQVYSNTASGPAQTEYRQQLQVDCWMEWNHGRRLCGAVSLLGFLCVLGPHEEKGRRDAHNSGKEWLLAKGPGTYVERCADPFNFEAAAVLLTGRPARRALATQASESATTTSARDDADQAHPAGSRQDNPHPSQLSQVSITLVKSHSVSSSPMPTCTSGVPAAPSAAAATMAADTSAAAATAAATKAATTAAAATAPAIAPASVGRAEAAAQRALGQAGTASRVPAGAGWAGRAGSAVRAAGACGAQGGDAGDKGLEGGLHDGNAAAVESDEVQASACLGWCMGVWRVDNSSTYNEEAGIQGQGWLPGPQLLCALQLHVGSTVLAATNATDVLSASQFPTLAESVGASKHGAPAVEPTSFTIERQQIIHSWPGRPYNICAAVPTLVGSPEKPRVLTVPRKGAHQGARGLGKGRGRTESRASRSATEDPLQVFIGLEYANWHGQRFLATPQQLGSRNRSREKEERPAERREKPKGKDCQKDKADENTRGKLGKGKDRNRDNSNDRDKEWSASGIAGSAMSASAVSNGAWCILSHDIPVFLESNKVSDGSAAGNESTATGSGRSCWSSTHFQLQRIHVVTPDMPLTFCSKPTIQFELPSDPSARAQLLDILELPLDSMVSGHATGQTVSGDSSALASSTAAIVESLQSVTTGTTSDLTSSKTTAAAASESKRQMLVQFTAKEELTLPSGSHNVIVLPLIYGLPEWWLSNADVGRRGGVGGEDTVGLSGRSVTEGMVPLLRLLELDSCNAVLLKGTMLYPK